MSEQTKIQYADHTFNPWIGCSKVSAGCANCYAERSMPAKMFGVKWGQPETYHLSKSWDAPLRWNADAGKRLVLVQPKVMVSLCDWLDPDVPIEWLARFLDLIRGTPNLMWLLTTKRIDGFDLRIFDAELWLIDNCKNANPLERRHEMAMTASWLAHWRPGSIVPNNVAVGVSVEDQGTADLRISQLLAIPAWRRWVSAEPLLGPLDLSRVRWRTQNDHHGKPQPDHFENVLVGGGKVNVPKIDWVAVGGESGPRARPCNIEWIRSIVRQCKSASVPCFVKQLGGNARDDDSTGIDSKDGDISRIPLRHPKGGDPAEWPEELRVREEMP
jgi:protein gp37